MRGLVQRVAKASVTVDDIVVSSIGRGICVLVGISTKDTPGDAEWLARKILNLRIFDDETGVRWTKSVSDHKLEVLCVSQFTLYSVLKGNKPDFRGALTPEVSKEFYLDFVKSLRDQYDPSLVKDGVFGADMQVLIQNDGPTTIDLESPPDCAKQYAKQMEKEAKRRGKQAQCAVLQKAQQAAAKAKAQSGASGSADITSRSSEDSVGAAERDMGATGDSVVPSGEARGLDKDVQALDSQTKSLEL